MTDSERLKILLVEDNRADAVLLQEMLSGGQTESFDLIWVDRLGKALGTLPSQTFDAVLLDLQLPDAKGLETLDQLHAAAPTLPIVIVTGAEDENMAMQAIRQGAQDYLVKGTLSARSIIRVIRYAIDRRRVEENLREAQRREMEAQAAVTAARTARDTINAMSEGVLILDMQGRILLANPAMERLSGFSAEAAVGRKARDFLGDFITPEHRVMVDDSLTSLLEGRLPDAHPFMLRAMDGSEVSFIPATAFIRGPDGAAVSIVVTLRDITALQQARLALEASEKQYRELVQSANSIIMRRRSDGTVTFVNEFAQSFFGFRAEEIVGRSIVGTIVPERDSRGRNLAEMIRNIGAHPEQFVSNENENICKDGRRVWVQWTNRALLNAAGEVEEILCVGNDATARKAAEESSLLYQNRLRSLANRLASTEEEERRRISRYIHDTVIQSLALANIKLGSLRQMLEPGADAEATKRLDTARDLIKEGISECRQLMSDLTPAMLYELGLEQALDDLVEKLGSQHEVDIRLENEGELPPMAVPLRGLLFQSVRELIVNALKHSGATAIRVVTRMEGDQISIGVHDNGSGFEPAQPRPRNPQEGGFGLFNLRERVEGLGGRFVIESKPGSGTTAVIRTPLCPISKQPEPV
jgi:PAS domain S-box-containing protein